MKTQDFARMQYLTQSDTQPGATSSKPDNPKEAAQQFEKVFAKKFVEVMTKNMFDNSMAGDQGLQSMDTQRRRQRDMMANMLTKHLVESDLLGLSDQLMKQWGVAPEESTSSSGTPAPAEPFPAPNESSPLPLSNSSSTADSHE